MSAWASTFCRACDYGGELGEGHIFVVVGAGGGRYSGRDGCAAAHDGGGGRRQGPNGAERRAQGKHGDGGLLSLIWRRMQSFPFLR